MHEVANINLATPWRSSGGVTREEKRRLGDAPGQNIKEFNIKLLHASARQPFDPLHATMQRPNLQRVCSSNPPRGFLCVALLTSVELADNVGCMHTNMPNGRRRTTTACVVVGLP